MLNSQQRNKVRHHVFPKDIGPHGILFLFKRYEYQEGRSAAVEIPSKIEDSILLPLPRQIVDASGIRISGNAFGFAGNIAASYLSDYANGRQTPSLNNVLPNQSQVDTFFNNFATDPNGAMGNIMNDTADKLSFLARQAPRAALSNPLIRSTIGDFRAVDAGLGNAVNPRMALSFEGVDLKNFEFDFELMPKSPEESETIRQIGQRFKHHALPSFSSLGIGVEGTTAGQILSRTFLDFPSMVDMFLVGLNSDYYMYYKTCMIQRFMINLTPTGGQQHAIMRGGKPAIVQMSISLIESDIRTRDDNDIDITVRSADGFYNQEGAD
jgi:hypothetical protein